MIVFCESRLLIFHFYYIQSILIQRGLCLTPRIKIKPDKRSHGSSCKLVEGWEWGEWELFPSLHLLHWNASLSPSLQNTADKVNTKLTYLLSCPPLYSHSSQFLFPLHYNGLTQGWYQLTAVLAHRLFSVLLSSMSSLTRLLKGTV